jgi:N-acetyl sugar amidotransferase
MDTSDSKIEFNKKGHCDHCNNYFIKILPKWNYLKKNYNILYEYLDKIKTYKKKYKNKYDCLIGVSGGVDSSYLTYIAVKEFKLKPLLFHVDAGWNTHLATHNISKLVDMLDVDLYTSVLDWNTIKDLQLAFFKAQVPSLDTVQDHAFFASLYNFAIKNKFKFILTGANFSTESIREPIEWHYHASDLRQIKHIHKKFGKKNLNLFPKCSIFKYKIFYKYFLGQTVFSPLNYIEYNKEEALKILINTVDYKKYEHKHYESRFTKFYEGYWLKDKYGFDKRRAHYSSLILTGQMSRSEALKKIKSSPYNTNELNNEFEYIATKLGIDKEELLRLKNENNKTYKDYKSSMFFINIGTQIMKYVNLETRNLR